MNDIQNDNPPGKMRAGGGLVPNLLLYINRQAADPARYALEQTVMAIPIREPACHLEWFS